MKNRGIGSNGVIIVRPDRYVAYRSIDAVPDAAEELNAVFDSILGLSAPLSPSRKVAQPDAAAV